MVPAEIASAKRGLVEMLSTLPVHEQVLLSLYYVEQFTIEEISLVLEESVAQVTKSLSDIRNKVKHFLDLKNIAA